MGYQIGVALLTIVISSAAGNIGQLFSINHPSKVSNDEPQVVEVVRWRQPVCVTSPKNVPPCLFGVRKSQVGYEHERPVETVADKVKTSVDADADDDGITGVLSADVVDTFSVDSVESFDLEISSQESRLIRSTPELDDIDDGGLRSGKLLVLPSFEELASLKTPPIFATKVLNSPVTATLVAKNCFPDIGVPLCEKSEGNKDKPRDQHHGAHHPAHGRRPGNFWEDPRSPYYDGGTGRLIDIPQEIPKFGKPIFENFRNVFLNSDASSKPVSAKIADIKQNVQSIFESAVHKLKNDETKKDFGLVQDNRDGNVGISESSYSLVGEDPDTVSSSAVGVQTSLIGDIPSDSSGVEDGVDQSEDNIKNGNFWEDPNSPYYDGGAGRLVDMPQEVPKFGKPIFENFYHLFRNSDASSKPALGKIINIKQSVQSIFDAGLHKLKQNGTKENFGSVQDNGDTKVGILQSIHSLFGKDSSHEPLPNVHTQTPTISNQSPSPSPIDVGIGKITDNIKKGQSILQNFHDIVKKPFQKEETPSIFQSDHTAHQSNSPQETLLANKNHSFLQSVHDIVKKPFQKAETIISQIKPLPDHQSKPSVVADLSHDLSDQSSNKRPFLQTIHHLVNKSYQHFQTPVTHLNLNIPKQSNLFTSKEPEIKEILVIESKPASQPSLFEQFWQPGAIFEKHTAPTANPGSKTTTNENQGSFDDWQEEGLKRTASVPTDSNVRESISLTLIEVPEEPASADVAWRPENGVKDKESEVPEKPVAEPRLLDTSNPVKSTIRRKRRDLSKGIFGSLGHVFLKPTDPPLLVDRPNQKPLLVRRPIYVVQKPPSFGRWWNPFSKPSYVAAGTDGDYEVVVEPVLIYEKPQQQPGLLKQFLAKPSLSSSWNILGNHPIFSYKNPTIDRKPVEINGQTSSVIRYPQKSPNVRSDPDGTSEVSKEQGHKNVLDNHRQPTQATDN